MRSEILILLSPPPPREGEREHKHRERSSAFFALCPRAAPSHEQRRLRFAKFGLCLSFSSLLFSALRWQGWKPKAGSTLRSSRAVPHPSTNRALRRLTSEVGRDPVHSTRYGRQRQFSCLFTSASFSLPLSRCRARDGPATSQALACVHPSLYLDRPFSHNKVSTAFLPLTAAAFFNHVAPPFIFPVTRSKSIPHTIHRRACPTTSHSPRSPAPCNRKKLFTLLDLCVSSLRRGHANLLCIVPILTDDPRRESKHGIAVLRHNTSDVIPKRKHRLPTAYRSQLLQRFLPMRTNLQKASQSHRLTHTRGHMLTTQAHYPTTENAARFCLLCCQPEPMSVSLSARMSQPPLRQPCRALTWLGQALNAASRT